MRKRIQTNNDRKEERNAGRGYGCGCGMGAATPNGAVASVSGMVSGIPWGEQPVQGRMAGWRHPAQAEASFAVK